MQLKTVFLKSVRLVSKPLLTILTAFALMFGALIALPSVAHATTSAVTPEIEFNDEPKWDSSQIVNESEELTLEVQRSSVGAPDSEALYEFEANVNASSWQTNNTTAGLFTGELTTRDGEVAQKAVSVGDWVWVDTNRDGVQDVDENGLPGITLTLVGPDGKPVVDVFDNPVGPTMTNAEGEYSFDNLPALAGDQVYTVVIDQAASENRLRPYLPAPAHNSGDRATDSSTWQAETIPGELHENADRDPTLDFGFVVKSYAIGDYVWVDTDRNGIQNGNEPALPGVTVELFDGAGEPVVDVFGNPVTAVETDADGRYMFDNLSAGTYQVKFALTAKQVEKYTFTKLDAGSDDAVDSDADPKTGWTSKFVLDDSNTALTPTYDRAFDATEGIDPTWDAGLTLKPDPKPDPKPGPKPDAKPGLNPDAKPGLKPAPGPSVHTGGSALNGHNLGWWALAAGLLTALATVGVAFNSRRHDPAIDR